MSEPHQQIDRRALMIANVTSNAKNQATAEHRLNYFKSCETHGGDLATVAAEIKSKLYCLCGNDLWTDGTCINDSCFNGADE